jgi:hypothetical protein
LVKKKLHGRTDTRGLSGAELAQRRLKARELRKVIYGNNGGVLIGGNKDKLVLITPLRAVRES